MHLNNKQLLFIVFPFILSAVMYFFGEEIAGNARLFFPTYEKYSNKELDEKTNAYFGIEKKQQEYEDIQTKVGIRKKDAVWVADNLLYKEEKKKEKKSNLGEKTQEETYSYKLQAIFDNNTVIINDLILKKGSMLHNAVIAKIENDRVLIKTDKGSKWLFLFL